MRLESSPPGIFLLLRRARRLDSLLAVALLAAVVSPIESQGAAVPSAGTPQATVAENPLLAEVAALKQDAVARARELAEAYPDDALAYALLGAAYYNTGRSEEATKYLQKCLQLNPAQADAYEILAKVAYEKGELENCVRLCLEALQRGPANADVLNRLGRAYMDSGQTEDAARVLRQAVELPKPVSESFYLLGQAFMQLDHPADAKESFQQAVRLLPDHTQAVFGLYRACLKLGQTSEAARYRSEFVKLEAQDRHSLTDRIAQEDALTGLPLVRKTAARTFFGAAQVYRAHREGPKAAELLLKSASLDPDQPGYRAALEGYYVQRNAIPEGITAFEKLTAAQPENPLNYLFLGRLHGRLNHTDAAAQNFRKVQALAPAWAEGHRALAELYLRADREPAVARELAQKAVQLEPTGSHYYLLAVACSKNEDRAAALDAIQKAVAANPGEKKYQELLQKLSPSR